MAVVLYRVRGISQNRKGLTPPFSVPVDPVGGLDKEWQPEKRSKTYGHRLIRLVQALPQTD